MSPPSTARAVDLPAPLGPTTAVRDPGPSARSSPSSARVRWLPRRVRVTRSTVTSSARTANASLVGADEFVGHVDGFGRRQAGHPEPVDRRRPRGRPPPSHRSRSRRRRAPRPGRRGRATPRSGARRRRASGPGNLEHGVAHRLGMVGVEHRGRLVEQQHVRPQRQDSGQGEALALTSGQRGREVVAAVRQTNRRQSFVDAGPDLVARQGDILRPEGDVAADAVSHHGVVGVLRQEPQPPLDFCHSRDLAGDGGAERPRQGVQQRRLAGAARAEQQHALAGRDLEVEVADDRQATSERSPGESGEADPTRWASDVGDLVASWSERVEHTRASQGPGEEPPADAGDDDARQRQEAEVGGFSRSPRPR